MRYPTKRARRETVAVYSRRVENVQDAAKIAQTEPLETPDKKQRDLVISASTNATIPDLSNRSHASFEDVTNPFPYAAICIDDIYQSDLTKVRRVIRREEM